MWSLINKLNNGIIASLKYTAHNFFISDSFNEIIRETITIESNKLFYNTQMVLHYKSIQKNRKKTIKFN